MRATRSIRRLSTRITAIILSSMVCVGSADLGHRGWDDPACDPAPVHHDHNAHRFKAGQLPLGPADNHCVLCHSLRSLRDGFVAARVALAASTHVEPVRSVQSPLAGRLVDSTAASRAPPTANL
jgi:hypothetical protein